MQFDGVGGFWSRRTSRFAAFLPSRMSRRLPSASPSRLAPRLAALLVVAAAVLAGTQTGAAQAAPPVAGRAPDGALQTTNDAAPKPSGLLPQAERQPPLASPAVPLAPSAESPRGAESLPPVAYPPSAMPPPAPPAAGTDNGAPAGYPLGPVYAPAYAPAKPGPRTGQNALPPGYPQPEYYVHPLSRRPHAGSHEHEGLFLRLSVGAGAAGMSYRQRFESARPAHVKTNGLAAAFELGLGRRVYERLIVHFNLSVIGANSRRQIDGVKDNSYDSLGTTFWLLGVGATYYFMPTNIYLTLVLGTGGMVERRDYGLVTGTLAVANRGSNQIDTSPGFASSFAIGKEWWVGGRGDWGIGASIMAALYAAPIDVAGVTSTAIGHSTSLAFSATLN